LSDDRQLFAALGRGLGKRGRELYKRREKRGREPGFPRWREAGANKNRAGSEMKGFGKRKV